MKLKAIKSYLATGIAVIILSGCQMKNTPKNINQTDQVTTVETTIETTKESNVTTDMSATMQPANIADKIITVDQISQIKEIGYYLQGERYQITDANKIAEIGQALSEITLQNVRPDDDWLMGSLDIEIVFENGQVESMGCANNYIAYGGHQYDVENHLYELIVK